MPKIIDSTPDNLKPYLFHGLELQWRSDDKDALGDCPICGRSERFSVKVETGQYQCFKCGTSGNARVFIRWLWDHSDATSEQYAEFATDRKLLYPETLVEWGVVRSLLTGTWVIPGYGPDGKLNQLYQYSRSKDRMFLAPTPTLGHQIFGVSLYNSACRNIYLCEGPWDAMALYEVLVRAKVIESGELAQTANRAGSLLGIASVLAVPSCEVFFNSWARLFTNKIVFLIFDNDHPRTNPKTKTISDGAGYAGMRRVAGILTSQDDDDMPLEVHYVRWGTEGSPTFNPDLSSGYDLRDLLNRE